MRRSKSWITRRAITSPADSKELTPVVSFPFDPTLDIERMDSKPGDSLDVGEGFNMTSGEDVKIVSKIVIRHPENPDLVLFGLRRDDAAWCTPGGHVDPGEDPMTAMFREFREECGLDLASAQHGISVEVKNRPVVVHIFEGQGPSPEIWSQLSADSDPDSEFICYQYIDPFNTDLPLHIPAKSNAVLYYLSSPEHKKGYMNSLMDLTTEKEAAAPQSPAVGTYLPQGPGLQFRRTDESLADSYHDENQFEDPTLKLGRAVPYDTHGYSPADPMLESLGDVDMVQHANLNKHAQDGGWITMNNHPVKVNDAGTVESGPAKGIKLPNAEHKDLKTLEKEDKIGNGKLENPKKVEGPGSTIHEKDKDAAIDNLAGQIKDKDWDAFIDHMDQAFQDAKIGQIDSEEAAQIGRSHNLTFKSDPDNESMHSPNKNNRGKEVKDPSIVVEFDGKFYALDGQHRLNNAIHEGKPANVAIFKGDFLSKFGITPEYFAGKKTYDKEAGQEVSMEAAINPGISTENSSGLSVKMENQREDFDLLKNFSVRTPV